MDSSRPISLSKASPARPVETEPVHHHRPSQSPFRYVHFTQETVENEKETPLTLISSPSSSSSSATARPTTPTARTAPPASPRMTRSAAPHRMRIPAKLKPWIPLLVYGLSSLGFAIAILFFKTQVFTFLDNLSTWLRTDAFFGYAVLFVLIFITTFPPIPMYSTLIVLSGYTFGPWAGAILSYCAALTGALTVFLLSRTLLRSCITRWLDSACTIKRVVRAVEKRPQLLFLVRLAPYPYNVMNCLLAASPTLTLQTYTICTAVSLFKVIIHTSVGASIHSFKDYHTQNGDKQEEESGVARAWTIAGLVLAVALFVYLSFLARRAINDELGDDDAEGAQEEETAAFLADSDELDLEAGMQTQPMVQLRPTPTGTPRPLEAC